MFFLYSFLNNAIYNSQQYKYLKIHLRNGRIIPPKTDLNGMFLTRKHSCYKLLMDEHTD